MGNDIDVCSKDELDNIFWREHGPKGETSIQFIHRTYDKFCDSICNPEKMIYSTSDLVHNNSYKKLLSDYNPQPFHICSQGIKISCCFWQRNQSTHSSTCIIYLHTNTRSIVDAKEILPVADDLEANVIAFDLPGCGKSDGYIGGDVDIDIECLIEWAKCVHPEKFSIVLWARGMATAHVIKLMAKKPVCPLVKAVVLDSPFIGIEQMVNDAVKKLNAEGYCIPSSLMKLGTTIVKSTIKKRTGVDPFKIKPLNYADLCSTPCYILSAINDDYIPASHGKTIADSWRGPVQYKEFSAKQLDLRSAEMVRFPFAFLSCYTARIPTNVSSRKLFSDCMTDDTTDSETKNASDKSNAEKATERSDSIVSSDGDLSDALFYDCEEDVNSITIPDKSTTM